MRTTFACWLVVVVAGCGGDEPTEPAEARWWYTCGDPACSGYGGPFEGVPLCTDEAEGDPCDGEGDSCDPQDSCNALLACAIDDPKAGTGGCPISLAAYKTDLVYLDERALRTAAAEAHQLRLATWRYRSEPADARSHLGFVIDDRPASPAVRSDGRQVDLYGYTSLALAAVQVQQAEIAALRAEVEALRTACESR